MLPACLFSTVANTGVVFPQTSYEEGGTHMGSFCPWLLPEIFLQALLPPYTQRILFVFGFVCFSPPLTVTRERQGYKDKNHEQSYKNSQQTVGLRIFTPFVSFPWESVAAVPES